MEKVYFEDNYIRICENEIKLLRNNYVHKNINLNEIKNIQIKKGHTSQKWLLSIIVGTVFILIPLIIFANILVDFKSFNLNINPPPSIKDVLMGYFGLFFFILFGIFFIKQGLEVSLKMKVNTITNRAFSFSLKSFEKTDELNLILNHFQKKGIIILN